MKLPESVLPSIAIASIELEPAIDWLAGVFVWLLDHGLLVALATAAAAWIAWQAHRREERLLDERREAADEQIAGLAHAVMTRIITWISDGPSTNASRREFSRSLVGAPSDRIEDRTQEMLALVPHASTDVARSTREAVVRIHQMLGFLEVLARFDLTTEGDVVSAERDDEPMVSSERLYDQFIVVQEEALAALQEACGGELGELAKGPLPVPDDG